MLRLMELGGCIQTLIDGMIWLLPVFILLPYPYPLTFLILGESMSVMQEGSSIDVKNCYMLVTTLNAEADGVQRVHSNLN